MNSLKEESEKMLQEIATEYKINDFVISSNVHEFAGENFLGEITRVTISDNKTGKKIYLILKSALNDDSLRENMPISSYYEREIHAYKNVLPIFDRLQEAHKIPQNERIRYAKFYKGNADKLKECIILEDLNIMGYQLLPVKKCFDYEQAELVIKTLARLHAPSFVLRKKDPGTFQKLTEKVAHSVNYGNALRAMISGIGEFIPRIACPENRAKFLLSYQNFQKNVEEIMDSAKSEPYNVICHGDCSNNNTLFKYLEGKLVDAIFVDWQIIRLASPVTDLAYMIFLTTDQPLRQQHFHHLLETYYSTLTTSVQKMGCDIGDCYPKQVFQKHVKDIMIFGLIMGFIAIPILLKEPGKEKTLGNYLDDINKGNREQPVTAECVSRINGIVDDIVKFNFI